MKRALWILAIVAVMTLASVDAFACTCELPWPQRTLEQRVKKARKNSRAVFSGRVLRIEEVGYMLKVTLGVENSWKERLPKEVVLFTGRGGGDCGYRFEVGEDYLVYAYDFSGTVLGTNICQRTMPLSGGADDLRILGKPKHKPV